MANEKDYQFRHNFFGCWTEYAWTFFLCIHWCNPHPRIMAHKGPDTVFYLR